MTFGNSFDSRKQPGWIFASIALIVAIALLSMRSFAAVRYPSLNSDNVIHVLMAYHLKLPDDLYYWGQNRLGSLLPILSHLLLKILPLPVVTVVSIVQYALLIFGFACFAGLFRHPVSRLAFALVWFLPLGPFTELVNIGQPYGPQLGLIAAACLAFNRYRQSIAPMRLLWLAAGTACLFLSLWVSDYTIVVIFLLALWGIWQVLHRWRSQQLPKWDVLIVLLMSGLGLLFIRFAKAHAYSPREYSSFATPAQSIEMTQRVLTSIWNTLTFQTNNEFLAIHALLAAVLVGYLIWAAIAQRQIWRSISGWFYLFLGTAILGTPLLLMSDWVYRNEVNLRYFTVTYISIWVAALLLVEALPVTLARRATVLLLLTALASSLSLSPYVYAIEQPKSKIAELRPLTTLGSNIGFIGDYWASYVLCAVDPAHLNCSRYDPRERTPCPSPTEPPRRAGRVRCMRCIPEVFASDTIYLVKNKWFDEPPYDGSFPNDTQQFRQCLVKAGEPREVAGYTIAPYRLKTAAAQPSS